MHGEDLQVYLKMENKIIHYLGEPITLHPTLTIIIPVDLDKILFNYYMLPPIDDVIKVDHFCEGISPIKHRSHMARLLTANTGIPIVMTTYSSLIISEIKDCCVYSWDDNSETWFLWNSKNGENPIGHNYFYGKTTNDVYSELFSVPERTSFVKELLDECRSLMGKKNYDESDIKITELESYLGTGYYECAILRLHLDWTKNDN